MFVSQASIDSGTIQSYGLKKRVAAVKNCRNIRKSDMKFNATMPKMRVDPESYVSAPSTCLSYILISNTLTRLLPRLSKQTESSAKLPRLTSYP